jgi:hypothetical protein
MVESKRLLDRIHPLCHNAGESIPPMRFRHVADAFAFSSLLPAGIAFFLSLSASHALVAPDGSRWAALAAIGTFIVYNLDRLRDTVRDRETSPDRTTFVERHRRGLMGAVVIAGLAFASLLFTAPPEILAITLVIGGVGLLHRRIKKAAALKALYVTLAWIGVCIGIPWIASGRPQSGLWIAVILMPILIANLIVSNLRDDETQLFRGRPDIVLRVAVGLTILGALLALLAPARLLPFGWLALAEFLAVLGFRRGERYGLLVIDGALLVGAGIAWLHLERLA